MRNNAIVYIVYLIRKKINSVNFAVSKHFEFTGGDWDFQLQVEIQTKQETPEGLDLDDFDWQIMKLSGSDDTSSIAMLMLFSARFTCTWEKLCTELPTSNQEKNVH